MEASTYIELLRFEIALLMPDCGISKSQSDIGCVITLALTHMSMQAGIAQAALLWFVYSTFQIDAQEVH